LKTAIVSLKIQDTNTKEEKE